MTPFSYARALDVDQALRGGISPGAKYLGGGTNLIDLMRENIERPSSLIDITGLDDGVRDTGDGGLFIGGGAKNAAVAENMAVRSRYPVLAQAIVSGASAQIRNMATVGGNILQRTRCSYFYDEPGARCNKRVVGQGCDAKDGANRYHAILGTSPECVATHPSDMCVALAALDAILHLRDAHGQRAVPLSEFHLLPSGHPGKETLLRPGELITGVELPAAAIASNSAYRKVRDRASYAFALVSVAAAISVERGEVRDVRIAIGGVAHKPWRARLAESALKGGPATPARFRSAMEAEMADAEPLRHNGFKIDLSVRTAASALALLAGVGG